MSFPGIRPLLLIDQDPTCSGSSSSPAGLFTDPYGTGILSMSSIDLTYKFGAGPAGPTI